LKDEPWRLYDLAEDRTETKDLAVKFPERVQSLSRTWEQWAKEIGLK
jgi:arylsulfatase